jgi:5-oxoprolinase (ATP-hydrolysing)
MSWHFWLDVGGTFTDCLARMPDATILRRKVLSSAITKGRATLSRVGQAAEGGAGPPLAPSPSSQIIHDPNRTEPANFWANYTLRLLDDHGQTFLESSVTESSPTGHLTIAATAANLQFAIRNLQFSLSHLPPLSPSSVHSYELVSPEEAPLLAIRLFLGLRLDQPIPPCTVRLGTTRGTNALLTRRGAKTAFITTRGFADILRIGYQNRPKLFELAIKKPGASLCRRCRDR